MGFPESWQTLELWAPTYSANFASLKRRRYLLDQVKTLTPQETGRLLAPDREPSKRSSLLRDQRKKGLLIGVQFGQQTQYPAFQFDRNEGQIIDEVGKINQYLLNDKAGMNNDAQWQALEWWLSPSMIDSRNPLQLLKLGMLTHSTIQELLAD